MFEILETFIYVILSGLFCPRVWWIRDFEVRLWGSHSMYIYDIPSLVRRLVTKCNENVKLSQCQSKLVWILYIPEISLWLLCTVFWSRATLLSDIFLDFCLLYAVFGPVSLCVFSDFYLLFSDCILFSDFSMLFSDFILFSDFSMLFSDFILFSDFSMLFLALTLFELATKCAYW